MSQNKLQKVLLGIITMVALLTTSTLGLAQAVPNVITFQSVLFDDSGNTVEADSADILFRVLDDQGSELYSEEQPGVEIFNGMINVLLGSGIVPGSNPAVPTGGLSTADFDPANPLFLEVTVKDITTLDPLELTSVPYAFYAQQAQSVAVGAITEQMIQNGAITVEHMENISISQLTGVLDPAQLPPEVALDTDISGLQGQITGNDGDIGNLNTTVSSLDGRVTNNEGDIAGHETRITALEVAGGPQELTRSVRWVTNSNQGGGGVISGQDAAAWALGGSATTDGAWATITRNVITVPSGCMPIASGTISPNVVAGTNTFLDEDDPAYLRITYNGFDINIMAFVLGDDGEYDINFRVLAIPTLAGSDCNISS